MIKVLENVGLAGIYFNIIKLPTDDIILNGEELKASHWLLGTAERYPLFPLLFNIVPTTLGGAIRQVKKIVRLWTRNQTISLCRRYVYIKNPQKSARKLQCFCFLLLPWQSTFMITKSNLGGKKRVYFTYTFKSLSIVVEESQDQNSKQESGEKSVKEHCFLVHSQVHTYQIQNHLHASADAQKGF